MNALCTPYEEEYYAGIVSLVNSIIKADYEGVVCVGSRDDPLPVIHHVANEVHHVANEVNENYPGVETSLFSVDTELRLARYKPFFLFQVLDAIPEIKRIFYTDPDLVFKAKWSNFVRWTDTTPIRKYTKQSSFELT